jgi:putative PEP-CTERM system TPR-repeat lipoprotein
MMHCPTFHSRHRTLVLTCCLFLAACGGESSQALVAKAEASLQAGDTKSAIIQLKTAIQKDEKNAEARFELGKLMLQQGEFDAAEKELLRAREAGMARDRVDPLLARAWIGLGAFQRVLDEIPQPQAGSPAAGAMLASRANAQIALKQTKEARQTLELAQAAAPNDVDVHLSEARLALAEGNADKAFAAIDAALKADPKHRDGWLFKADLLRTTGKTKEALAAYQSALQIDPQNLGARLALADIAIAENRLDDGRREVDAVLKIAPNNLLGHYTQALIDFRENKIESARDRLAVVLKSAPDFLPAVLLGGTIEYALGNLQSAETSLNKVAKAAPSHPQAIRLLAAVQLRLGRPDDAARTLRVLDPENASDAGVHVLAGEIALAKKEWAKATAHFEKAAQISPESAAIRTELGISRLAQGDQRAMADLQAASDLDPIAGRADAIIILTQIRNKQFDAALASIAALEKKIPDSPIPWNYRGAAYLGKKDLAKARESFERVLKIDPTFFAAAATLAQMDLQDNRPAAAKARFQTILKADPKHLQAMLALAELARLDKDEKNYLDWLEKAAAANPKAPQPSMLLSRYWLSKGNTAKATVAARAALSAQPDNPAALDLLGNAQFAGNELENALGTYRKLADLAPNQAEPRLKLAKVQIALKQPAEARNNLQEAIKLKPDLVEAQLMLGTLDIQAARYDDALKIARQIQQKNPGSIAGWVLQGDAALARKQYPAALSAYERAHKLAPSAATLIGQHQALSGAGRFDEGAKRLTDWLAAHPQDRRARLFLAERLALNGKYQAAADQYLTLNQQAPGNVVILNNLASALSELNDKRALGFAEQALKLKPDNPAIMDTAGWILVKEGQHAQGIKLLQQALSKLPDAAEIQWHLASAYATSGDRNRARSELERLLASGTAFRQEQEARDLLKQLQGKAN